jgi:glycosyltransferase involved in cell wall biosynthesis
LPLQTYIIEREIANMRKKNKIGVLCYSLMPATIDILNRLDVLLNKKCLKLKAFPLVENNSLENNILFSYRPTSFSGRFMEVKGRVPDSQLLTIQASTILNLVKESDLIILLGIQSIPAILTTIFAKLQRKPVLTINQTMPPEVEKKRPWYIRWAKRIIYNISNLQIAQTKATEKTLSEIYRIPNNQILYAPFDGGGTIFKELLKYSTSLNSTSIRDKHGIPEDAVVFLFVGTLIYLKGVDVLIDAVAMLEPQNSNYYLLIIGADGKKGGQLASLQSKALDMGLANRILFAGQKSMKELVRFYLASDVFVFPTRKDVWPKVLVEAALTGLPMITTSVTGQANLLVKDGINGFIVPPNDFHALSHAMLKLMKRATQTRMGDHSRKIVKEFVQPEIETDKIIEGILSLLQSRK